MAKNNNNNNSQKQDEPEGVEVDPQTAAAIEAKEERAAEHARRLTTVRDNRTGRATFEARARRQQELRAMKAQFGKQPAAVERAIDAEIDSLCSRSRTKARAR